MPIYEYQCDKCHHHLEALQKLSDKPLRECPECGKHSLRRLVSAPRFRLAGSGWYETDFKSDNDRKRNLVEKEKGETAAASPASTADGAADKAPAAAPVKDAPAPDTSSKRRTTASKPATAKPALRTKPKSPARPAVRKAVRKR